MNVDNFVYIVDQTLKNLLYPNIIGILFWDRGSIVDNSLATSINRPIG
jgi:hypothetical protein